MSESRSTSLDDNDVEERVGVVWRVFGVVAVVLGLCVVGVAIRERFVLDAIRTKGFAFLFAIGAMLCYLGITWIRGKKFVSNLVGVDDNTVHAGRGGRFDKWPADCHPVVDQLRPLLLKTGAWFDAGNPYEDAKRSSVRPQARIGWTSWTSAESCKNVLAVLRPATDGGGLEMSLRVGPESGLISTQGPLFPSAEGGDEAVNEFGTIRLRDEQLPADIHDWIARAGDFTREKYNLDRKGRRQKK